MMTTTNPLRNILGERPLPPLLTHAQEIELANRVSAAQKAEHRLHSRALTAKRKRALRRTMADGQAAREALVLHNLPLVAGDEPRVEQVAEMAGVTAEAAANLLRDGQGVVSLDAPVDPDDRAALERIADNTAADPEQSMVQRSLAQVLEESLARLDE